MVSLLKIKYYSQVDSKFWNCGLLVKLIMMYIGWWIISKKAYPNPKLLRKAQLWQVHHRKKTSGSAYLTTQLLAAVNIRRPLWFKVPYVSWRWKPTFLRMPWRLMILKMKSHLGVAKIKIEYAYPSNHFFLLVTCPITIWQHL